MPGSGNQGIKLQTYDTFFNDVDLGLTSVDTEQFTLQPEIVDASVDQFSGAAASFMTGLPATVAATFLNTSVADLISLFRGQVFVEALGSRIKMSGGTNTINMLDDNVSGVLLLHPHGVPRTDRSNDIYLPCAAFDSSGFNLAGSRTKVQDVPATFKIFPNTDLPAAEQYWTIGDWSLSNVTPLAVLLRFAGDATDPLYSVPAITLNNSATERIRAFQVNGTVDTADTALLDGAIAATDTSLSFDTGITANAFQQFDYLQIGSEYVFVQSIAYVTTTSGTMTISRGLLDTVPAAQIDNEPIHLVSDVSVIDRRDSADWVSSDPLVVTVGDSYPGTSIANRKGQMININPGATTTETITATYNSVTSADLTVTANAV